MNQFHPQHNHQKRRTCQCMVSIGCISQVEQVVRLNPSVLMAKLSPLDTLTPLVRWEENWSLVSSDWPGSRTQEGGCKEGWGGRGAWMVGDGRGEGRGGVTEQRGGGGKWWWMDWDGGGERRWRWTERGGDEGWGEGGLHQILLRRQGEEEWKQGR